MAKRSGPNIPDDQRHTAKVQLRLPPDLAAELRRRGVGHPGGASGVVAELLAPLTWRARMTALHDTRGMVPAKVWDGLMADLMAEAELLGREPMCTSAARCSACTDS